MKTKLFAAFVALFFYSLVVIGLKAGDSQIPLVLFKIGLTNNPEFASSYQLTDNGNLIDPRPAPPKIDPRPAPPKIDPRPAPPKIDPRPAPPKVVL